MHPAGITLKSYQIASTDGFPTIYSRTLGSFGALTVKIVQSTAAPAALIFTW